MQWRIGVARRDGEVKVHGGMVARPTPGGQIRDRSRRVAPSVASPRSRQHRPTPEEPSRCHTGPTSRWTRPGEPHRRPHRLQPGVAMPMAIGLGVDVDFDPSDGPDHVTSSAFEGLNPPPVDLDADEGDLGRSNRRGPG